MARAQQRSSYDQDADLSDLAGAYTFGVVRDHPFVDGDKRTGFVLGILFLELNGEAGSTPTKRRRRKQ